MGWAMCIIMLYLYIETKEPVYLQAAGLFSIAGAIGFKDFK